ncbi:uncharacterized protein MONOS_12427 [Monocercomonoides exilis]|uniref:uncharacterized protein n=1 Tax=Monocercomonoides exilis TaxID=2049356 RepID=UPI00355A1E0C|nr:hypothetical protein MONOS_12427 [Monocercomonoides exilis]|eukprot:MONOS_12427.1-p1 / transcript=MONOS_12427.1 / gene=MONOS_12427 / organism=Monocercomonoides_exilis_PA203 / gene_product=unspecified product / transcript_product=unspecified product / location=Mono_scaffold00688:8200-8543(-) / protein_length=86 / sequence_SO=supercontig / SO=protein_coding / is_pseudo=false
MGGVNGKYILEVKMRDREMWGGDVFLFSNAGREEGSYEAEQEGEYLWIFAAPLICRARDGGGGGGRREEGTSALALCIGGVETEA